MKMSLISKQQRRNGEGQWCLVVFLALLLQLAIAQEEGDPCMNGRHPGVCIAASKCPQLEFIASKLGISSNEVESCGFDVYEEIICCPREQVIRDVAEKSTTAKPLTDQGKKLSVDSEYHDFSKLLKPQEQEQEKDQNSKFIPTETTETSSPHFENNKKTADSNEPNFNVGWNENENRQTSPDNGMLEVEKRPPPGVTPEISNQKHVSPNQPNQGPTQQNLVPVPQLPGHETNTWNNRPTQEPTNNFPQQNMGSANPWLNQPNQAPSNNFPQQNMASQNPWQNQPNQGPMNNFPQRNIDPGNSWQNQLHRAHINNFPPQNVGPANPWQNEPNRGPINNFPQQNMGPGNSWKNQFHQVRMNNFLPQNIGHGNPWQNQPNRVPMNNFPPQNMGHGNPWRNQHNRGPMNNFPQQNIGHGNPWQNQPNRGSINNFPQQNLGPANPWQNQPNRAPSNNFPQQTLGPTNPWQNQPNRGSINNFPQQNLEPANPWQNQPNRAPSNNVLQQNLDPTNSWQNQPNQGPSNPLEDQRPQKINEGTENLENSNTELDKQLTNQLDINSNGFPGQKPKTNSEPTTPEPKKDHISTAPASGNSMPNVEIFNPLQQTPTHENMEIEAIDMTSSMPTTTTRSNDRPAVKACTIIDDGLSPLLTPHILGGVPANEGEFPHMAALGYPNIGNDRDPYSFDCGGTLIDRSFVLTAAHCLNGQRQPTVVRLGTNSLKSVDPLLIGLDVEVKKIHIHPDYKSGRVYNDIGLLELAKPVVFNTSFLYPTCLYTDPENPPANKPLYVTGWGTVNTTTRSRSNILLKADQKIISTESCNLTYIEQGLTRRNREGVLNTQLCAHDEKMKKDSCQGDSGGPLNLVVDESLNKYRIVGIISAGFGCGSATPSLFTRVSAYLDYIESIVWPTGS